MCLLLVIRASKSGEEGFYGANDNCQTSFRSLHTQNVYVEEVKQTNIINILGLALILGSNNNEAKKTVAGVVFEVKIPINGSH